MLAISILTQIGHNDSRPSESLGNSGKVTTRHIIAKKSWADIPYLTACHILYNER